MKAHGVHVQHSAVIALLTVFSLLFSGPKWMASGLHTAFSFTSYTLLSWLWSRHRVPALLWPTRSTPRAISRIMRAVQHCKSISIDFDPCSGGVNKTNLGIPGSPPDGPDDGTVFRPRITTFGLADMIATSLAEHNSASPPPSTERHILPASADGSSSSHAPCSLCRARSLTRYAFRSLRSGNIRRR